MVWLQEGYAYAASQYRRGGFGVLMAAEDTENLRRYFVKTFGRAAPHDHARPVVGRSCWREGHQTLRHGSGGPAQLRARAHERRAGGAPARLTSVSPARGPSDDCRNHPRPEELSIRCGRVAAGREDDGRRVRARVNDAPEWPATASAARRSGASARTSSLSCAFPDRACRAHDWATLFADIVHVPWSRNPFGNEGVRDAGSDHDAALNAGVARYRADPRAVAALAATAEPAGRTTMSTLTGCRPVGDPTAFS